MSLSDFLNTPRSNVVSSIIQFPATDIDGMVKRLKLKDHAHEQGSQNLPPTEGEGFDPVERAITSEIEHMAKEQYDLYLEQQKVYAERAADTSVRALTLKINSTAQDAITELEKETHVGTGVLYARKREVVQTEKELNDFRKRHHLERPPRNYESKAVKVSLLGLLLAIEAVLNGFFLSKGSEFGLIGGVLEAMIIAGLNIAVGVSVGRFIAPWLAYRNWTVRFFAVLGMLLYLAAAIGFNLAVAHYRTAMTGDPFEASITAYRHLIESPLAIEDLESWGLFVMGFLFSLFAAGDGWWMDDPYPGYGRAMRHNLQALDNYNALKHDLFSDLDHIKTSAEEEIDDITRAIGSRQGEFNNIVMRSEVLKGAMLEHFDHLQSAANHLLTFYRNENQKHRKTEAPARFNNASTWTLVRPSTDRDLVSVAGRENFDAALAEAFKEIPPQRDALHKAYRKALNKYTEVDVLVENEANL